MESSHESPASASGAATKKDNRTVSWGAELPIPPRDAQTERDVMLLRGVIRNEALVTYDQALTPGAIANLVNEDIASIGEIKDSTMRAQAMFSARQSRAVMPDYKVEFSRMAPVLANAVDAARHARTIHAPELRLLSRPAPANQIGPATRARVAAFLYADAELVIDQYPDLAPAYGTVNAARKFAERNFPGHEKQFVALAIDVVVSKIERGDSIPDPGLKTFLKYNGDRRAEDISKAPAPHLVR
jgi:hypothetical protein